ncbi:MAG TPA: aminotransferase class I/II-fold pyridoxal phosphate-dependent enzyme [Myxococcales bacterium]|nr:aminotransferase class I/II-fold pyridoxal phosphate-dependent enzyme [Myxococcales bacterium]
MPLEKLVDDLKAQLADLDAQGTGKGREQVVVAVKPPQGGRGPRFLLEGEGEREFIRMNSNSYLGLSLRSELIDAEEQAAHAFGVGPGAVRFISGTYDPHVRLEQALADFHGRPAAMIAGSAYTAMAGVLFSLSTPETVLVSDELNHNCIVNGMKLAPHQSRKVYGHLDLRALEQRLEESLGQAQGALVITDGVFSMRGDHAPVDRIADLCRKYDPRFERGCALVVDDSHGVGGFGTTGRGTEEVTGGRADVLVGTLGKAMGVNGGYIATDAAIVRWLREKNPFYIYSNPIAPGEAAAALAALELIRGKSGVELLSHLRSVTQKFRDGLVRLGFETIAGQHPVVPLLVRDTDRTRALVAFLRENGVLATGLNHPVVPRGEQLIRFQVSADHTDADIDSVLAVLSRFR